MKAFIGAWLGTKHDAFIGWVLRLNHNAVDATASGKIPVEVELLYNGNPITAGKCEYLCKSVADSGMGNGYCGFSIPVPQNYAGQEKAYTLRIRGTQFVLSREAQAFGLFENKLPLPQLEGHMDDIHNGMVRGWAWNPAQPDEAVMVDLLIDGVAVQRIACNDFRADLKTHGKGDGRHAFHALLPLSIHDGGPHDVHVRFTNTRIALAGSPRSVRLMPGMPAHMVSQADFLLQDYRRQLDDISRMLSSAQTVPQAELQKQSMQLDAYKNWVHRHDTLSADDRLAITARVMNMQNPVTFSIIMPVYNPEPNQLRLAIDSVQRQLYPYWELCIADDASTDPEIARILKKAAKDDARIKVKTRSENGHIALASNDALTLATGGYAAFLDHDDMLAEHALYVMADAITRTHAELLYSDEDKIDMHGVRYEPYFKPDWNYDLMLTQNFACHFLVMKRDLLQSLGGLRSGFDGSQDHDLVLRASEKIPALSIHHVPFVLYHWRAGEHSTARTTQAKP